MAGVRVRADRRLAMAGLGVLMPGFYTGLVGLVAVKWRDGTWAELCGYVQSLAE